MNYLSKLELGNRLAQFRKAKDYSQEELASTIGISRPSLVQIESGKRNIDILEMQKFANTLGFSIDEFLTANPDQLSEPQTEYLTTPKKAQRRKSVPVFDFEKFTNCLLYVLEKTAGKPGIDEKQINSLFYFIDFNYYEIYETHLSSSTYRKRLNLPIIEKIDSLVNQLINDEAIIRIKTSREKKSINRLIPLKNADLQHLKASEVEMMDMVCEQMSNWSASKLETYTQEDVPCKATKEGDSINFELAFYRDTAYSVRFYNEETD
ncbi:MAG: helix-turn-helix domain-containing protein [Sediminibacterium sp.]